MKKDGEIDKYLLSVAVLMISPHWALFSLNNGVPLFQVTACVIGTKLLKYTLLGENREIL